MGQLAPAFLCNYRIRSPEDSAFWVRRLRRNDRNAITPALTVGWEVKVPSSGERRSEAPIVSCAVIFVCFRIVRPPRPKRGDPRRANFSTVERLPVGNAGAAYSSSQIIPGDRTGERIFKGNAVSLKRRSFSILSLAAERKYGPRRGGRH